MSSNKGDQKQSMEQSRKTQSFQYKGKAHKIISNRTRSPGNYSATATYWTSSAQIHIMPDYDINSDIALWFERLTSKNAVISVSNERDEYIKAPLDEVVLALEFWNLAKSGKIKVGGQ